MQRVACNFRNHSLFPTELGETMVDKPCSDPLGLRIDPDVCLLLNGISRINILYIFSTTTETTLTYCPFLCLPQLTYCPSLLESNVVINFTITSIYFLTKTYEYLFVYWLVIKLTMLATSVAVSSSSGGGFHSLFLKYLKMLMIWKSRAQMSSLKQ